MSELNAITQDIKNKKEKFLGTIQEGIKNKPEDGAMENYTKEDKNKLNDLLKTFSTK